MSKKILLTVFNDVSYDQRMIRICTSLANAGYEVVLVGRKTKHSIPLIEQPFQQIRLSVPFQKGLLLYAFFNLRLFFYLLLQKADAICAIDLDTIIPCYCFSRIKNTERVYDAHELFCEMKEIVSRPRIYRVWKKIEKIFVPRFQHGYTVNQPIADEFFTMYKRNYEVIRNIAVLRTLNNEIKREEFIICQGAVNEGRCFETLIPAMKLVDLPLVVCGDGNFMDQLKKLIEKYDAGDKVTLKGLVQPGALRLLTQKARLGISLFENGGRSVYLSLANRFFDYMHAGTPQLCSDFPAYREINNLYEIAVLIKDVSPENIARQINGLLKDRLLYDRIAANCVLARQALNWEEEEKKLIGLYKKILPGNP